METYINLKEKAYELIKNKIINLEFQPGEYLEEKKLVELLDISRTPIREALSKLESEMWVKNLPRKGVFVSNLDEDMLNTIFQVRTHFEPAILEMAYSNLSELKLELFKSKFEKYDTLEPSEQEKIDNDFHNYIFNCVDNIFVKNMMKTVFEHLVRVRKNTTQKKSKERIMESNEEHIETINHLLNRDKEKAVASFKRHMENSYKYYLGLLF